MSQPAQALAIHESRPLTNPVLPLEGVREMVVYVQTVTRELMVEDEDYGNIPGVKNKILMQPGAQKLGLAFQLRPEYHESVQDHGSGHRTYDFKVVLIHRGSGQPVGEGVGSCSTLESKYRYRWDSTGRVVPQEYWEARDPEILGGPQFKPRKVQNRWQVFQQVEHPDPADYYNTCRKMAKKRAYVDAMITATACSHLFTQDLEETLPPTQASQETSSQPRPAQQQASAQERRPAPMPAATEAPPDDFDMPPIDAYDEPAPTQPAPNRSQQRPASAPGRGHSPGGRRGNLSEKQIKRAWAIAKSAGVGNPDRAIRQFQTEHGCVDGEGEPSFHAMTKEQYDEMCDVYLPNWEKHGENDNARQQRPDEDDDFPF